MRTDFPTTIDSTMRAAFRACPQKFFYEHILQIAPKGVNRDLHAGASFAAGVCQARRSFYEDGLDQQLACAYGAQAAIRSWGSEDPFDDYVKSQERILLALSYYFEQYPLGADALKPLALGDGKYAIETSFALPIPNTKHPTTGDPILYAGRYDMIGELGGSLFVVDEKTAKQLGQNWSTNWTLRSQFTGYVWGAQSFGHPCIGAIVRGISFLKNGYDTQQAIVYRPQWQIARWLEQLQRDVASMIAMWREQRWDLALDTACSHYGGCPFLMLCDNAEPQGLIDIYYREHVWDPLRAPAP